MHAIFPFLNFSGTDIEAFYSLVTKYFFKRLQGVFVAFCGSEASAIVIGSQFLDCLFPYANER